MYTAASIALSDAFVVSSRPTEISKQLFVVQVRKQPSASLPA